MLISLAENRGVKTANFGCAAMGLSQVFSWFRARPVQTFMERLPDRTHPAIGRYRSINLARSLPQTSIAPENLPPVLREPVLAASGLRASGREDEALDILFKTAKSHFIAEETDWRDEGIPKLQEYLDTIESGQKVIGDCSTFINLIDMLVGSAGFEPQKRIFIKLSDASISVDGFTERGIHDTYIVENVPGSAPEYTILDVNFDSPVPFHVGNGSAYGHSTYGPGERSAVTLRLEQMTIIGDASGYAIFNTERFKEISDSLTGEENVPAPHPLPGTDMPFDLGPPPRFDMPAVR